MNDQPLAAIIILNWNNWQDTIACVESCLRLTWQNARIILVDNGSTDTSESVLRDRFPAITIIQTGANLGFAGGNNVGIRYALESGADYVWLLNNDAMADPQALTMLIEALGNDPVAGIAGSMIYFRDEPRKIWFAGGIWTKGHLQVRQRGTYQIDTGQYDVICAVGSISGCSMLIRSAIIEKIGLMDETYFLYWEDTDWCAKARKAGYRVLFVPGSKVWHKISATMHPRSELQSYYNTRNGLWFCRRHDPASLPRLLLYLTADVAFNLLRSNLPMFRGFWHGIADFISGRTGKRLP